MSNVTAGCRIHPPDASQDDKYPLVVTLRYVTISSYNRDVTVPYKGILDIGLCQLKPESKFHGVLWTLVESNHES